MKFEKAPLIELVAEFRWIPIDPSGKEITIAPASQMLMQPGPQGDLFYDTFRNTLGKSGYLSSERLVPVGFPHPLYQPIFRYSNPSETTLQTLYQAGPGVFSVHALPPYESWEMFRPVIQTGLDALIASRPLETAIKVFTGVTLRYIDAFSETLVRGLTTRRFLQDVLQISVNLPKSLVDQTESPESIDLSTQIRSRLKSGLDLTLSVGANVNIGATQPIVMDTIVSSPKPVPCVREDTLAVLDLAHDAIRQLFVGMTEPIHSLMVPSEDRKI